MPREIASGHMLHKMGIDMSVIVQTSLGTFSTKETPGAKGNILSVSQCGIERKSDNLGSSSRISVSIADYDGVAKTTLDLMAIDGTKAYVFQKFEDSTTLITLLKGRVASPISWDEGTRTIAFTIEADVASDQIGYAPTKDDFPDLSEDAYGTPWPMLFGTVFNVPTPRIRKHAVGTLHSDIGLWSDPGYKLTGDNQNLSLDVVVKVQSRLDTAVVDNKLYVKGGKTFPQDTLVKILIDGVAFRGKFSDEVFTVVESNAAKYENIKVVARVPSDPDFKNPSVLWIEATPNGVYPTLQGHHCYFKSAPGVTWYGFCVKQSGAKCVFRSKFIAPADNDDDIAAGDPAHSRGHFVLMGPGKVIAKVYQISRNGMRKDIQSVIQLLEANTHGRGRSTQVDGSGKSPWGLIVETLFNGMSNAFWRAYADTEVRLVDESSPDIYVVSSVPCTQILGVYGKKIVRYDDGKQKKILAPIPKSYYVEQLVSNYPVGNLGDTDYATAILFYTPLADYKTPDGAEEWDETIYISAVSTVGPNTVDIIKYLLLRYTDVKIGRSFDVIKDDLAEIPSNFAIFDRRDAIKVCEDIAWQARCALLLDSGKAEIVFLDKKPRAEFEFNVTNVSFRSVKLTFSETTDIKTKFLGTWTPSYEDAGRPGRHTESATLRLQRIVTGLNGNEDHRTRTATKIQIFTENIPYYGEHLQEWNFWIYDNEDSVQDSLAFWGHRAANSWKVVELQAFHDSMSLTLFDGVNVNLPGLPVVRGVIESSSYDAAEKIFHYRIWLPVIAGHNVENDDAWLS